MKMEHALRAPAMAWSPRFWPRRANRWRRGLCWSGWRQMHDPRDRGGGRAARRAPERAPTDPGGREDRPRRRALGRRAAADRGGELRVAEMGAADGRRRG